jgi:hypothetical protein
VTDNPAETLLDRQLRTLFAWGLDRRYVDHLVGASLWFQEMGGTPVDEYWKLPPRFDLRDEFFLVANSVFALASIVSTLTPAHDWCLSFQVAFLYQTKAHAQGVVALDTLARERCYADAFAVARAIHSRVNLLVLCSLAPGLFDRWLKNPQNPLFLDGNIRAELEAHGIDTMDHLYEAASEILHGQHEASTEIGYLQKGVFPDLPPIADQLYTMGKFMLAASAFGMIQMSKLDGQDGEAAAQVDIETLYDRLQQDVLHQARLDHLWTTLASARHWRKVGKDRYDAGGLFRFSSYRDQLEKFHRSSRQRKTLSKKYRILLEAKSP